MAIQPISVYARLLLISLVLGSVAAVSAPIQPLDSIIAIVNDDVIVRSELNQQMALMAAELESDNARLPPRAQFERQVLDRLIDNRLQIQRARRLGIEVDDTALNQAISRIAERNGLTVEELHQALTANGIDFADFRRETRMQMLTARLQNQEVAEHIRVTATEIDRFLEREGDSLISRNEVRLQHLLIALPDDPTTAQIQAAEQQAQTLLRRMRGGEDFARLARAHSDGQRAQEGGDLGWFALGEVPSLAVEPAMTLRKGEVSAPIRSPSGFHLIRLMDFRGDAPEPVAQTHARHILVRTSELISDADAQQRLRQLRQRIQGGESFDRLARSHSNDTGSALRGGDLGWINPGDTVPDFENAMNQLAPGEISAPFQSPFGWHIVQVIERRQQDSADGVMRQRAEDAVRARKAEDAAKLWLQQLRDEAYVEIRLPALDDD